MIQFTVAVMVSALTGAGLFWPPGWRRRRVDGADILACLSLALGLGLAIGSVATFAALGLGMANTVGVWALDATTLALAWLVGWSLARSGDHSVAPLPGVRESWSRRVALGAAAAVVVGLAIAAVVWRGLITPGGTWDAWAIWNYRALWFFRAPEHWTRAFTAASHSGHPDYPLLLPLSVLRLWLYAGAYDLALPRLVGLIFFLLVLARLAATLARLRGWPQAVLGVCALVALPMVTGVATDQLADLPLAFFMLTVLATGAEAVESRPSDWRLWAVCGFSAGAAAWTKNEGVVFLGCLLIGVLASCPRPDRRMALRVAAVLAGAAPMLATVAVFKMTLAADNYLAHDQSPGGTVQRLLDSSRHVQVWRALWDLVLSRPANLIVWLLPVYAVAAGWRRGARPVGRMCGITLLLLGLAYYTVYIITPLGLNWQLGSSLERLVAQVWPPAVLAVFLLIRPPGEWGAQARI